MSTNPIKKFVCIHGHFYQPPRENAWLETIETQEYAAPFHDFNDKINYECYAPNAAARLIDSNNDIIKITNNYKRISFNIGPTLLSWIEKFDPGTYLRLKEADKRSQELFGGHGSAIAQVYNHMIMPLSNTRDKETQIIWGIEDFKRHFGRHPEGIWLAETAVDHETLELCVKHGIKYTILAPQQSQACRRIGEDKWQFGEVDPRRPYKCVLPNGKSITLFVYDGNISQDIAFKGLLNDGNRLADRLCHNFANNEETQLVHVATDGESYGHHHNFGEMALAACIDAIEKRDDITLTNYGEFLANNEPTWEIMIHEDSSWSCVHGIERWRSNCGCETGGKPGYHQKWRAPLRATLDELRDSVMPVFVEKIKEFCPDPWAARDGYIHVIFDRSEQAYEAFIKKYCTRPLNETEQVLFFRSMEMQRNAMLMFTSCAWFFHSISGIETDQVLQYALRVIRYCKQISGIDYYDRFLKRLKEIPSNIHEDGSISFLNNVVPRQLELRGAGIHFAIVSLFTKEPETITLYNYHFEIEAYERHYAGQQRFAVGRITMHSKITKSQKRFSFAVLYLGQQNIIGSISKQMSSAVFYQMYEEASQAFDNNNLGEVISAMERHFDDDRFTIWNLFKDEKKQILQEITENSLKNLEAYFRNVYAHNYQLMGSMQNSGFPVPEAFLAAVRYCVNTDLSHFFRNPKMRVRELERLAKELERWDIKVQDVKTLKLHASERIFQEITALHNTIQSLQTLKVLNQIFKILAEMGFELDTWKAQNVFYRRLRVFQKGEAEYLAEDWKEAFFELGKHLKVKVW